MASTSWSLTTHLLSIDRSAYELATQAPFLLAAGKGSVNKKVLGKWLANDRLYIHAYIKAVGRALSIIDLPETIAATEAAAEIGLVDWLFATLVGLRREERLFIKVAHNYGIDIDLETDTLVEGGGREIRHVPGTAKIPGLIMFERIFGEIHPAASVDRSLPLPWLEAAVVFWATEKVYLDAWTWARTRQQVVVQGEAAADGSEDADGGALRKEFIPNWSNEEFVTFISQLSDIIDRAVSEAVQVLGDDVKATLAKRAEKVWREVVAAEAAFWPDIE